MTAAKALPTGTPIAITAHRHIGWTGTVERVSFGLYDVRLTHDGDGERLAAPHRAGPFVRAELTVLTDPQPGSSSSPAIAATDGGPFSETMT